MSPTRLKFCSTRSYAKRKRKGPNRPSESAHSAARDVQYENTVDDTELTSQHVHADQLTQDDVAAAGDGVHESNEEEDY